MITHINLDKITLIKVYDRRDSGYKWLPERQRTKFFNLFKKNSFQHAGYYADGKYFTSGLYGGIYENSPRTAEYLIKTGYQIDDEGTAWERAYIVIRILDGSTYAQKFDSYEEAKLEAERVKSLSKTDFVIYESK